MERIYTIPLRRGTMTAPRTRRAKKAVLTLKGFIKKHMKTESIKLSEKLNEHIWSQGMRNPIMKVKVIALQEDDYVHVRQFGEKAPVKVEKKEESKPSQLQEKVQKLTGMKMPAKKKPAKTQEAEPKTPKDESKAEAKPVTENKPVESKPKEDVKAESKPVAEKKPVETKPKEEAQAEAPKTESKPKE